MSENSPEMKAGSDEQVNGDSRVDHDTENRENGNNFKDDMENSPKRQKMVETESKFDGQTVSFETSQKFENSPKYENRPENGQKFENGKFENNKFENSQFGNEYGVNPMTGSPMGLPHTFIESNFEKQEIGRGNMHHQHSDQHNVWGYSYSENIQPDYNALGK